MNRREFIHVSCSACCLAPAAILLNGCSPVHYVTGSLTSEGILLSTVEFLDPAQSGPYYRKYIIVRHDRLEYPICLYRLSETDYSALLMQCTHQGTELQAGGDKLHCPAHGSEYDQRGKVTQGPSERNLRTFPVIADDKRILIPLT
jgi:Rieske Fe-S protein